MKLLVALTALSCGADAFSVSQKYVQSIPSFDSTTTQLHSRQPIMAGNWKMNPSTLAEALGLASGLTTLLGDETCPMSKNDSTLCTEVVLFPPYPFLGDVKNVVEDIGITLGAQSIFYEEKGAYTGSVSTSMVKSMGCQYVLCGHSERRTLFNDSDLSINRKVAKVLDAGMRPILCVGETKSEYELDIKNEVCALQLSKDLLGVTKAQMKNVVIAYEPVWAIGTGLVCGAKDADDVHAFLRTVLTKLYDEEVAEQTRIQYGGSVTPDSVDELMSQPNIDGCLVGGASLVAAKFGRIINFVKSE